MRFYLVISEIFSNFAVYLGDTQREAATRCSWSQSCFFNVKRLFSDYGIKS